MNSKARSIAASKNFCGEAPVWTGTSDGLFWVDTGHTECFNINMNNDEFTKIKVDGKPQALGKRKEGGWICPMEDRVVLLDNNFNTEKDLGSPLTKDSPLLIGDGSNGPDGCFYFGVYHPEDLTSKEGAVYRVNQDLSFELVIPEMALPNGMAFSKEGNRFFLTEMFGNCIWSFDFDKNTGKFCNKKLFVEIPESEGYPDGLIMDDKDGVWSAHWQGFRVTRYSQDGTIDMVIEVPVPTATCMAFGDSGDLYITTAVKGCSEEQLEEYPDSGNLFKAETEYNGYVERDFLG